MCFRLLDRGQRTRSISKLNSFGFCSLYHFCLNVQFPKIKLVRRIELRTWRRSWSCESWSWSLGLLWIPKEKEFLFWDVAFPQQDQFIINDREREGFYLLHKNQWNSKPFRFNGFLVLLGLNFFGRKRHD